MADHMSNLSRYYLQQMGITLWQCHKPDLYPHSQSLPNRASLPKNCRILIVSDDNIAAHSQFITNVLSAMYISFNECLVVSTAELAGYQDAPEWIWCIGCEQYTLSADKSLFSPNLEGLLNSGKAKRHLWQQIINLI